MTDKKLNIFQKLVEVRKKVIYIQKNTRNPRFPYACTSDLLAEIRDEMDYQGIVVLTEFDSFNIVNINGKDCPQAWIKHTWVNAEDPSDRIETKLCFTETTQTGCQSSGSILTYSERYMLYKTLLVATDEADPDAFFARREDTDTAKPKEQAKEQVIVKSETSHANAPKRQVHTLTEVQAQALAKVLWTEIEAKTKVVREFDEALPYLLMDIQSKAPDFDIWKSKEKLAKDPEVLFQRIKTWKDANWEEDKKQEAM